MEIQEEFISGFCRTCNGTQTVYCEYEEKDGYKILQFMDCAHDQCLHHAACEIYKEAHRIERKDRDI
ncbi:hypothetical protein ACTNEW_06325 [Blautia sp. HCP3S3_G3]|uniref:hypothetical protein n=1 Tax=Blautia sp. HCP3S3_G3 TaxID=3438913 RepID=UPI003F898FC4